MVGYFVIAALNFLLTMPVKDSCSAFESLDKPVLWVFLMTPSLH